MEGVESLSAKQLIIADKLQDLGAGQRFRPALKFSRLSNSDGKDPLSRHAWVEESAEETWKGGKIVLENLRSKELFFVLTDVQVVINPPNKNSFRKKKGRPTSTPKYTPLNGSQHNTASTGER